MTSPWSGFSLVGATLKRGHSKRLYSEASCGVTAPWHNCSMKSAEALLPQMQCFFREIYLALKYSKTKYRKDFLMLAGNGIEIHTAPNEFIPTFKLPSLPAT